MKPSLSLTMTLALSGVLGGCTDVATEKNVSGSAAEPAKAATAAAPNPFFTESPLPLHFPRFDKITDADFAPGFDRGMADQRQEVRAHAVNESAPTPSRINTLRR